MTVPGRHLGSWGLRPLRLLSRQAAAADVFELALWRRAVVGFKPDWNRAVLRDLVTFRNTGSLSDLTPYLRGGVVRTDVPAHALRRRSLNRTFRGPGLARFGGTLRELASSLLPDGRFEALEWSSRYVRQALGLVLFGGGVPDRLLARFLSPLHRRLPHPFRPRPWLFRSLDRAIHAVLADPPPGTVAAELAGMEGAAEELRIALAAGYDTTSHTLAWALWHRALEPSCPASDLIDEVLRLYPAGWIGSRITAAPAEVGGVWMPEGTLVLYSPYLTHRDPALWKDPLRFDPARFHRDPLPAWGYVPFSAGPRTCLGAQLARLLLEIAATAFAAERLTPIHGDPAPLAGLTLRPRRPLVLSYAEGLPVRVGRARVGDLGENVLG